MEKLIKIQSELRAPKNQFNKFGGYKYRSQEDILEAVKPLLKKYDCTLFITDDIICIGEPHIEANHVPHKNNRGEVEYIRQVAAESGRVYVRATVEFTDGEKSLVVNAFAREADYKKGMDVAQVTGSASSYARKYALSGLFLLDDVKDPDADISAEEKKDTLKENTKQYKAVVKYIREGGSINEVEKRFKVSNPIKKKIYDEIQVQ